MKKKARKRSSWIVWVIIWTLLAIWGLCLGGYALYKFVIVPQKTDESQEETKAVVEPESNEPEVKVVQVATKEELLAEVNRRRAEVGVAPLQYSPELEATAQEKCDDMVARNYYDHVDPDGLRGVKMAEGRTGWYGYFNENLLRRFIPDGSANAIFDNWFFSKPHREEAINAHYTLTGFGICGDIDPNTNYESPTYYIVEHFYGPG